MNLNLELTLDEVNMILRSLGKHPFDEIAALIGKIKNQGEAQVAAAQQEAEVEASEEKSIPVIAVEED
jgi:hypothetical protein